jgi:hypothetical protein
MSSEMINSFYVSRAMVGFRQVFGDDPNVVAVWDCGNHIGVRLVDLEEGIYPPTVDGVSVVYISSPLDEREAS